MKLSYLARTRQMDGCLGQCVVRRVHKDRCYLALCINLGEHFFHDFLYCCPLSHCQYTLRSDDLKVVYTYFVLDGVVLVRNPSNPEPLIDVFFCLHKRLALLPSTHVDDVWRCDNTPQRVLVHRIKLGVLARDSESRVELLEKG